MDILHSPNAAPWMKKAYFFMMLNAGLLLTAVGIAIFKTPNHFAFGGTSGLSIVLSTLFPKFDVASFMWIINAALVVVGIFALGPKAMGWTVYSSFALSAYVSLCQMLWPMPRPLTNDTLLEMCFAVLLPAVGSAMVFDVGASTGGTDIVAMILAKHTSIEIGKALMLSDAAIVAAAALLYGPATGLYCILGLVAKASVVDGVIENMNLRKVCTVVTFAPEKVQAYILNELHRSATVEKARGAYTQREEVVLTTVLTRRQAAQLRDFLRAHDPAAFITIVNSSEIIGKGFRSI